MKKSDRPKDAQQTAREAASPRDVVLVHGVTEDKKGLRVLRARDQTIEAGEVRPLREGQPITSDVVRLHAREGVPFVYDVETTYSPASASKGGATQPSPSSGDSDGLVRPQNAGPAQVASRAYRENWDVIWAKGPQNKGSSELN